MESTAIFPIPCQMQKGEFFSLFLPVNVPFVAVIGKQEKVTGLTDISS